MTIKTLKTGSTGNCYILTSDNGHHLILDCGIPVPDIKKGLDFDIEYVTAVIVTHGHNDHVLSAEKLKQMGMIVWQPYLANRNRMRLEIGEFEIECFDVPHGVECRAFLIRVDGTTILYATDYEYIPYNLSNLNINVALIELNYQSDRITEMDKHRVHTVTGHAEEKTVIEFLKTIKGSLRTVILCHMSKSGALDRDLAMKHIREVIPEYINVQWAKANEVVNINEIPF